MNSVNDIDGSLRVRASEAKSDRRYVQTPRLVLMPLKVSDASQVFKWCGDPEVTKFMNYSTYGSVEEVKKWIREEGSDVFGFFLCDGTLIGSGSVNPNRDGICELGYNLAAKYWGYGYATEACKAMIAYAVAVKRVNDFYCKHAADNVRSAGVIEKLGFVFQKDGEYTCLDGVRKFASKQYSLRIDSREMNVDGEWFGKIAQGTKTVELRLNDEKRRGLKIGDYIALNELEGQNVTGNKCVVKVTAAHAFEDFDRLYKSLDMVKCGYGASDKPDARDMLRYYSLERQKKYGVLGIEFELLGIM